MRCAQWAVRDCLPTAAYPVPQSVTEREQSCRSLIIEPEQIAEYFACDGHPLCAADLAHNIQICGRGRHA